MLLDLGLWHAARSVQANVFPRDRIFNRLEVGEDGCPWERGPDVALELFEQVVTTLHGPVARDQDVQFDKSSGTGLPRAQGVPLDISGLIGLQGSQHGV